MKDNPRNTELFPGVVVDKTDLRIELRGKIDSALAWAWYMKHEALEGPAYNDAAHFACVEIPCYIEEIQKAEALDDVSQLNYSPEYVNKAREIAAQAYGRKPKTRLAYMLNVLRTKLREAELSAIWCERSEVIDTIQTALNTLSAMTAGLMTGIINCIGGAY